MTDQRQIETLKRFYDALNRSDSAAGVALLDPEILRVEFDAGTYRGLEQMREHLSAGRSTWAEGSCEPKEFRHVGDKIIVRVRVHVRLKNETKWIDAPVWDGYVFRQDKILEFRSFAEERLALAWVGTNP